MEIKGEIMENEIETYLEQPKVDNTSDNSENCPTVESCGSNFGKFASHTELVKAYENLHKEFTRKCQVLCELEKKSMANEEHNGNACAASINEVQKVPYVMACDESDKSKIIEEYLMSVAKRSVAPAVITTNNDFAFGKNEEPRSIGDLGKIVENFFQSHATK